MTADWQGDAEGDATGHCNGVMPLVVHAWSIILKGTAIFVCQKMLCLFDTLD